MKTQIIPNLGKMSLQQFFNQLTFVVYDNNYQDAFWNTALPILAKHISEQQSNLKAHDLVMGNMILLSLKLFKPDLFHYF